MKQRGRPIRGLIGGFVLGIFVDLDLVFGGVVNLDSAVLTILPIALLVVGLLLGLWAPVGRSRGAGTAASSSLPPPVPSFSSPETVSDSPVPPPAPAPSTGEDSPPI